MQHTGATDVFQKSIERCRGLLSEKQKIAQAEYAELCAASDNPEDPFDPDNFPEKPEDPLGDPLSRMGDVAIDDAVEYAQKYLDHLSEHLVGMDDAQAQRFILNSLRAELREHLFYGTSAANFDFIFSLMIELEDQFEEIAVKQNPHSGDLRRLRFFGPIGAYCEVAEQTACGMEAMLHSHQAQMGWPEDVWCDDLFRIAQRELEAEGVLKVVANDDVMSPEEVELCGNKAEAMFAEMMEPYAQALPVEYCPEHAWFIYQLTHAHLRKYPPDSGFTVRARDPIVPEKTRDFKCKADNDVLDVADAVGDDMTRIFLKHLDTAEDPYVLLAAVIEADAMMNPEVYKKQR